MRREGEEEGSKSEALRAGRTKSIPPVGTRKQKING